MYLKLCIAIFFLFFQLHFTTFDFMKNTKDAKPYSLRLNEETKSILQRQAMQLDRSLQWLIIKIIKEYIDAHKTNS